MVAGANWSFFLVSQRRLRSMKEICFFLSKSASLRDVASRQVRGFRAVSRWLGFVSILVVAASALGQSSPTPPATVTSDQARQNMMEQLGIKAMRPGYSGNEKAPNHANYDESKANPFPNLPDPLLLNNGQKVATPEMWWNLRRPELLEMFSKYVYGRVPPNMP